jgi:uronate dehydrogenase
MGVFMKKVLLTGAAGGVAQMLRPLLVARYRNIVLSDRTVVTDLVDGESFILADLSDPASLAGALKGVDRVIHLGGRSVEGTWDEVLQANIIGLHNFYEACRAAKVRRVVFASSNHAAGFYPRNQRIGVDRRTRPDSRYGVSKVFGEAMASLYADKFGISSLSIRIGNIGPMPLDTRRLSIWLHPEDMMQLCEIGLEHPDIHSQIVWGMSDNDREWWDNQVAYDLGYRPSHQGEEYAEIAMSGDGPPDPVGDVLQGGGFCSAEFNGVLERAQKS